MIIRIEDAPAVKHLTIDIDFTGDDTQTTIIQDGIQKSENTSDKKSLFQETALNLDEDFTQEIDEEVQKPDITVEERAPKVSQEMNDMEL